MILDPCRQRNVAVHTKVRERIRVDQGDVLVASEDLGERSSSAVLVRRYHHDLEGIGHTDVAIAAEA
jgi:hypothetical protein